MTRQKFVEQYLEQSTASTQATRRITKADAKQHTGTNRVDYHVDQQTTKE